MSLACRVCSLTPVARAWARRSCSIDHSRASTFQTPAAPDVFLDVCVMCLSNPCNGSLRMFACDGFNRGDGLWAQAQTTRRNFAVCDRREEALLERRAQLS